MRISAPRKADGWIDSQHNPREVVDIIDRRGDRPQIASVDRNARAVERGDALAGLDERIHDVRADEPARTRD